MLTPRKPQQGATLIETLVAILIVSFGLMALAGLQATMSSAVMESYQRAQALTLMQDMAQRIEANQSQAALYAGTTPLGTGDSLAMPCATSTTPLTPDARRQLDLCEWSSLLKGASVVSATNDNVGGLVAGRGCVEQLQAPNTASGVCVPGNYRITVAWQGQARTVAPEVSCGINLYADEALRKTVSSQVLVALPGCS
jgi:type IV pilus assembly protein PilV